MELEEIRDDVRDGRIDADRLVDLIVKLQRESQQAKEELEQAKRRIEQLEQELGRSPSVKVEEPFSLKSEEQRQEDRGKKGGKRKGPSRGGRTRTADKVVRAKRTEQVFPAGVAEEACYRSHTRVVWRLENGQAVLVAYEIYRGGPKHQYGKIPGVLGRGEFGIEIILTIAYQVYIVELSFDKVCLQLNFFQNLQLTKSQVDALLNRLQRHWESEFDVLCTLLANSLVVHADETSWSIHSVWAFLSEKVRLLFFGVHKDAQTLEKILDPATFPGIVISDDASVYANFTQSQKCWAHLLRKAIKLTLLDPTNEEYREFTDRLLAIYREACRVQCDGRLSPAGRKRKVAELDEEIFELCNPVWGAKLRPTKGPGNDYRLLVNELMRLMVTDQLFTFVTAVAVEMPSGETVPVAGTNNEAERTLRPSAQARKTGRTNKTLRGARRRTVIVSVLESLRQQLPSFTLSSVIDEIQHWSDTGQSCFVQLLKRLKLPPPTESVLPLLFPTSRG